MVVVNVVLTALALLLVGLLGALVNLFAMAFTADDCGGEDEGRWRCTGQPQAVALIGMASGVLVAVALTLAPLVTDAGPGMEVAGYVLAGSLALPVPFVVVVGSIRLPRRWLRRRR